MYIGVEVDVDINDSVECVGAHEVSISFVVIGIEEQSSIIVQIENWTSGKSGVYAVVCTCQDLFGWRMVELNAV